MKPTNEQIQHSADEEAEYWHHVNTEAAEMVTLADSEDVRPDIKFLGHWTTLTVGNKQVIDRIAQLCGQSVSDFTSNNLGYCVFYRNYQFIANEQNQ